MELIMARTLRVVSCPDRLKLAFCLLEGDNKNQAPVQFMVKENDGENQWAEYVNLDSIGREDGSGGNFNLTGWNTANKARVRIFLSLKHRSGVMTFE